MKRLVVIFILFSMIFCSMLYAQQVTVDLQKLEPNVRNAIIDANKEQSKVGDPESWKKWAEVGKSIGLAIGETAKQLNVEVNSFIKTPAGIITVALISYKIAGHDILRIILGIPLWCVITFIVGYSFLYFHGRERVIDEKTKQVTYVRKYPWQSNDARSASAAVHVIIWVVATLVLSIIIL